MFPQVFESKYVVIHTHTVFLGLAVVLSSVLVSRDSIVRQLGVYIPPTAGIGAYLSALVGAKFFWLVEFYGIETAWRAVFVWEPGYAFYGGLAGVLTFAVLYTRIYTIPFLRLCDLAVPYMALVEAVTRIGCFLNGCCYGKRSDLPWALSFPRGSAVYNKHLVSHWISGADSVSLPVHPSQLYMCVLLVGMWWILRVSWTRRPFDGALCIAYAALYAVYRFIIEFIRDDSTLPIRGLSVPQGLSIVLLLVAVVAWLLLRRRKDGHAENRNGETDSTSIGHSAAE
ncbi:MAG: hypothetical protein AMXMBFR84_35720 [Candidatus Hydrogenedentota bacterium]